MASTRPSAVLNILARRRDPAPTATILTPEALRLRHAPVVLDCACCRQPAESVDGTHRGSRADGDAFKLYGMRAAYDEVMAR